MFLASLFRYPEFREKKEREKERTEEEEAMPKKLVVREKTRPSPDADQTTSFILME